MPGSMSLGSVILVTVDPNAFGALNIPTGGFDLAGVGREGGLWGMHQYLTTINRKGDNLDA